MMLEKEFLIWSGDMPLGGAMASAWQAACEAMAKKMNERRSDLLCNVGMEAIPVVEFIDKFLKSMEEKKGGCYDS